MPCLSLDLGQAGHFAVGPWKACCCGRFQSQSWLSVAPVVGTSGSPRGGCPWQSCPVVEDTGAAYPGVGSWGWAWDALTSVSTWHYPTLRGCRDVNLEPPVL